MKRRLGWLAGAAVALLLVCVAFIWWLNVRGEEALPAEAPALDTSAEAIARGEYLARAGNCISCHTARGGVPYAGGRGIETPFGMVFAGNLTPDPETGLGGWNAAEFWRALRHGRSRDGRLLYPAFPYTSYTHVTRQDSDAIFAFLQSLPPERRAAPSHELAWPFDTQWALAMWRAMFFRAASVSGQALPTREGQDEWNRGLYLVEGLGHCAACHTPRNRLGGLSRHQALGGGVIPVQNWYAPALNHPQEAGLAEWEVDEIVQLFQTGMAPRGNTLGPMAEVVWNSLQYLEPADLRAMAVYLQDLPQQAVAAAAPQALPSDNVLREGRALYEQHCLRCHGAQGEGVAGVYPPLAGNRAVLMRNPTNIVQMLLHGGYAPATQGNPRPHGMPPFIHVLSDAQIAQVGTYIRNSWGNRASALGGADVFKARQGKGNH